MTTIAIPALDAEKLKALVARCVRDLDDGDETFGPIEDVAFDAYTLAAQRPRSDYAAHLDTALSEIDVPRIGALREGGEWRVTLTTSDGNSRDGTGPTFVEALLEAVLAVVEMREATTIKVGDRVRVKAGCFVPPHLSHQLSVGYASNEEYLRQHRGALEGVVTDIDGDIVRLDGALEGHRIERYERVPTHAEGEALLRSVAGR